MCYRRVKYMSLEVEIVTVCRHDIAWHGYKCYYCGRELKEGEYVMNVEMPSGDVIVIPLCEECIPESWKPEVEVFEPDCE